MATRRHGRFGSAMAGMGLALALTACGGASANAVNGSVVLRSADNIAVAQQNGQPICAGKAGSGYDDIIGNQDVVVTDGNGKELARTKLGPGQPSADGTGCTFAWQVAELPEASSYLVTIGNREPVPYTLDELRRDNFAPVLALNEPGS